MHNGITAILGLLNQDWVSATKYDLNKKVLDIVCWESKFIIFLWLVIAAWNRMPTRTSERITYTDIYNAQEDKTGDVCVQSDTSKKQS